MASKSNPNGAILYRGPSLIDGAPIVVIATGLKGKSANGKTGDMVQTWILREDMAPTDAVKTGADVSICGQCPHRGDGTGKGRTCYVTVFQAPLSVWKAYKRGAYAEAIPSVAGRMVRLGSYGDPAAVPTAVWAAFTAGAIAWTGYTHQWRTADAALQRFCMASCDSEADRAAAKLQGWRTFRVVNTACGDAPKLKGEVVCPASEEAGRKLACETCKSCDGTASDRRGDIVIRAHGAAASARNLEALAIRLAA